MNELEELIIRQLEQSSYEASSEVYTRYVELADAIIIVREAFDTTRQKGEE